MDGVIMHRRICHSYQGRLQVVLFNGRRKENVKESWWWRYRFSWGSSIPENKTRESTTVKLDLAKKKKKVTFKKQLTWKKRKEESAGIWLVFFSEKRLLITWICVMYKIIHVLKLGIKHVINVRHCDINRIIQLHSVCPCILHSSRCLPCCVL